MMSPYFFMVEFRQPQLSDFYCKFYKIYFTVYILISFNFSTSAYFSVFAK